MNKKTLGLIIVVGLAVGLLLAVSVPKKSTTSQSQQNTFTSQDTSQNPPAQNNAPKNSVTAQSAPKDKSQLTGQLSAKPSSIKAKGSETDMSKVEKSLITVSYKNEGSGDAAGLQLWLQVTGGAPDKYNVGSSEDTKLNLVETQKAPTYRVFNISDVKAGGTGLAHIFFFSEVPGTYQVAGELRTALGAKVKTETATITVK